MSAVSANKSKDQILFRSLQTGLRAHVLVVTVNAERLNHVGSPVWDPWENVLPLLFMFIVSTMFTVIVNAIVGVAMIVLTVLVHLGLFRPWVLQNVSTRAKTAAMKNHHNWNVLWRAGGLSITYNGGRPARCVSPRGDWQAFVTRYLPHQDDEIEFHGIGNVSATENGDSPSPASLDL